jgi:hypothetical protein
MISLREDSQGFTILETIIAGALMMGLAMVLLQLNTIQQRSITANEAQNENVNLALQIYSYLRDTRSCNATLGAGIGTITSESDLGNKSAVSIKSIARRVKNAHGEWETIPVLSVGQSVGNQTLQVADLKIRFRPKWEGFVDLVVSIRRTKIDAKLLQEKVFPVPVELVEIPRSTGFRVGCAETSALVSAGTDLGFEISNENPYGSTGFARDSTVKILEESCKSAGGKWLATENRCATAGAPDVN